MRRSFLPAIAASGVLLLGSAATAQYRPPPNEYRYQDRDYRVPNWMFERLRTDLNRAELQAVSYADRSGFGFRADNGDRHRIQRARQEMNQFRRSMRAGEYSGRQFAEMNLAFQLVIDNNRMSNASRQALSEDLERINDWWGNLRDRR